jgi:hypothetical protein
VELNPIVRARAALLGAEGADWLNRLPDLIRGLERRCGISVGQPFGEGTAAYVAAARTRGGTEVVLNLAVPAPKFARQVRTIAQARGRGDANCWPQTPRFTPCCSRRSARRSVAFRPNTCVIVHGDTAASNALQCSRPRLGAEAGYVFVDPDGFLGDPAYEFGVAVRDWTSELLRGDAGAPMARYCRRDRLLAIGRATH